MARIRPFRAWRYNPAHTTDINANFSPLFDVVSREQLERLYQTPNNSIHVSVPRSTEAVLEKLDHWKESGILLQDPLPGIYVYYQEFSLFGESKRFVRKGFVSMIRIGADSGSQQSDIVLHEDTISSSVAERSRLLELSLLNAAPTHGLYEDPEFQLEALMDAYMQDPLYEYIDYQGVINKLAIIQDRRDIARFTQLLATQKVYLADGHHRLASSVALQQQSLKSGEPLPPDSFLNYHLMYLTNLCADDLRILPIHRLLSLDEKTHNPNPILARIHEYFDTEDITFDRKPIYEKLKGQPRTFGMVLGSLQFLLRLKPEVDPIRDNPLDLPNAVKELDYTILHYFVFDRVFDMPYRGQHGHDNIEYIKDGGLAMKKAVTNRRQVAFITRDTSMEQMMAVCRTGALMPQKSTYFYPKVVCGLVFASINDNENNSPFDIGFRLPEAAESAS
ncbi:MAG: DUF1015 domain-containing protein [Bacteroidota bacterium]